MRSTARRPRGRGLAVLLLPLIVIAAVLAGCGSAATGGAAPGAGVGGAQDGLGGAPAPTGAPAPAYEGEDGGQPAGGNGTPTSGGNGGGGGTPQGLPAARDLLIIKTGTMTLQVAGVDAALAAASQQVAALGGYASASERSGDGEGEFASITFRIPADRWDEALTALRGLAEKVLDERTGTQDVTSQVIDLGARIKNLQATETALQAIMAQATQIKDVLAVQAELTQVREQIERLTAEKGGLEEQASYSTLTVGFQVKPTPVLTAQEDFDPASQVDQASASLVSILQGLATAGIWFAIVWVPILLALAVIVSVVILVFRRFQRRGAAEPLSPATGSGA